MSDTVPDNTDLSLNMPDETLPSQLQEVTLDQDLSDSMSVRSSSGLMRGRSIKEFEEQLSSLKKENFNLKLRIYFLEERMGTNLNVDKEMIVKKNVDLMVAVEDLRRELQEKQDLLVQAVKAMDLEEEENRKSMNEKNVQLDECREENEKLKLELEDFKKHSANLNSALMDHQCNTETFLAMEAFNLQDNNNKLVKELETKINALQEELIQEKETNSSIQLLLDKKENEIKLLKNESNGDKLIEYEKLLKDSKKKLDDLMKKNQLLNDVLKEKNQLTEQLMCEKNEILKKFNHLKCDLEKEYKRYNKLKYETDKKIKELENKLEESMLELKKCQDLVVTKTSPLKQLSNNIDKDSFSVTKSSPSIGITKTSATATLYVSPLKSSPNLSPKLSPKSSSPDLSINFDKFLLELNNECLSNENIEQFIVEMKNKFEQQRQKIIKSKSDELKACAIIKNMISTKKKTTDEILQLNKRIEELEKFKYNQAMEKENISTNSTIHVQNENSMALERSGGDVDLTEHYKALANELEIKNEVLLETVRELNNQIAKQREQFDEVKKVLKIKSNRIVDLEFELLSINENKELLNNSNKEKNDTNENEKTIDFYKQQIIEKDKEINLLKDKLVKRNFDLQGIVNHELWEKNREIEKLQKSTKLFENRNDEINKLTNELQVKTKQLDSIKNQIYDFGFDINENNDLIITNNSKDETIKQLKNNLKSLKDEKKYFMKKIEDLKKENINEKLQIENNELRDELIKSEKLRDNNNEICSILSGRLEELAIFLDSLLKNKSILGFLGINENNKLRKIIDQSLDLSRSFTVSMLVNPEQSLTQLTNITSLLNNTTATVNDDDLVSLQIQPGNASLTYQSHLYKNKSVNDDDDDNNNEKEDNSIIIATLRQQIINLKYELQLRDVELNKLNGGGNGNLTTDDEKNKLLSLEFPNYSPNNKLNTTTSTTLKYCSEIQSESEAWSEPDRTVSRQRIGLLDETLNKKLQTRSNYLSSDSTTDCELNEQENLIRTTPSKSYSYYNKSRQTITELNKHIYVLEEKLKIKENQLLIIEQDFEILNNEKLNKNELEIKLNDCENKLNIANNTIEKLNQRINELEENKLKLQETMLIKDKETQNQINQIEIEKTEAINKSKMIEKYVNELKNEIENIKIKYESEKEIIQKQSEVELNSLKDTINKLKVENENNEEFNKMKLKLQELNDKFNNVRKDLDNTTIQYSEVVLENTKLLNEKLLIEEELNLMNLKENELKLQLKEIQNELKNLNELNNKQLINIQNEKSKLEVRISELESLNAELINKLIKKQSEFNNINKRSNYSVEHSGYTSEEHCNEEIITDNNNRNIIEVSPNNNNNNSNYLVNRPFLHNVPVVGVDVQRYEANASPDLGIESDQGRFSSLETHLNIPRPFLQPLELTESMNNLLDIGNAVEELEGAPNQHCCTKTLEMANENDELRRKLLKTRRALEETLKQLSMANQRKKQVEKTICKQIRKTSQVLRKVKTNLDSGSETDVYKKF